MSRTGLPCRLQMPRKNLFRVIPQDQVGIIIIVCFHGKIKFLSPAQHIVEATSSKFLMSDIRSDTKSLVWCFKRDASRFPAGNLMRTRCLVDWGIFPITLHSCVYNHHYCTVRYHRLFWVSGKILTPDNSSSKFCSLTSVDISGFVFRFCNSSPTSGYVAVIRQLRFFDQVVM